MDRPGTPSLRDRPTVGDRIVDDRTPEDALAALDGQVPVALLPVRVETRFSDGGATLRIRVFPDDIHVHTHEPELTTSEEAAGHTYWRARFADPEASGPAWREAASLLGPHRARWVVAATTPLNPGEAGTAAPRFPDVARRDAPWTRAPQVAALPQRWVAIGMRGDREVFRKWGAPVADPLAFGPAPDPDADEDTEVVTRPDAEQDLAIDDGMRWLIDFEEAERVGMALTVTDADLLDRSTLAAGLTRLVVLGVDTAHPADESAHLLGELLAAHSHTEGLSLVPAGTPTNNTTAGRTPLTDRGEALDALDPARTPPPTTATSDTTRLTGALGLAAGSPLATAPGSDIDDGDAPLHMHTALWEATWGYFLGSMLDGVVPVAQVAELRDHFRHHVRGSGPLGTLRVGDQPYGVLPVVAPDHWRPDADETSGVALMRLIGDGRGLWSHAADRSPRMGRTGDAGRDLLEVLQHTPEMTTVRFRNVFGPLYTANTTGLSWSTQLQDLTGRWLFAMFGGETAAPRINLSTLSPHTSRLTVPLVQGGDHDPAAAPEPDYISQAAERLSRSGGFAELEAEQPTSLLHALILHSAKLEMARASVRWINDTLMSSPGRPALRYSGPEFELLDIGEGVTTQTPLRVARTPFSRLSGELPIAEHIAGLPDPGSVPPLHNVAELRDSLRHLAGLPVGRLERLLKETLDVSSHRLDAWLTSFATRRLGAVRAARPTGIHLGGFGWVEDLHPGAAPASRGYVHTPSMAHAATAAILRSGHLTHAGGDASPFAVDISAPRVSQALALLDGVRQGQPIGALLGYRFERSLRERDPRLARYILPFRRLAPLAYDQDGTAPAEAIAARDVVDGVVLLERWRRDGRAVMQGADVAGDDRPAVAAELHRLDGDLDAVADLLVAESVFQAVGGNLERAGAATAALDRQRVPPEPDVVRTPRHGYDHVHRVGVLLDGTAPPQGWETDVRSRGEPRLDAWLGAVLGDPTRFRFGADVLDDAGTVLGTVEADLSDLALSPLSVLAASGSGGTDRPTELEERIALHLSSIADDETAAELHIITGRRDSWPASALTLGDLLALADSARAVTGGARPLDATLLALPEDTPSPGIDRAELRLRADVTVAAAATALDDLGAALESPVTGSRRFGELLLAASAAGARDAVPLGFDTATLREQAGHVARDLATALSTAEPALAAAGADTSDDAFLAAVTTAVKAVLGADFPFLPRFSLADPAGCAASLADRGALLGGDELAPAEWLQRRSLVRSGAARLHELLTYAELAGSGTGPADLSVLQLPHRPGDRWFSADLPDDGTVPAGRISLTMHSPGPVDISGPLAGIVVDDWMETIPAAVETTGVAFHYDAPGSRAPQAVLLAVPPDPAARSWSFEALRDTVIEAAELARIRAVDPQQVWLAGRVLPALYVAHNIAGDTAAINLPRLEVEFGEMATREEG